MSNRDECCLFGVRSPSGIASRLSIPRWIKSDFWPALGGARSWGIVSAAPGGGTCCTDWLSAARLCFKGRREKGRTYTRRRADDDSRRQPGVGVAAVGARSTSGTKTVRGITGLSDVGEVGGLRGATVFASMASIVLGQRLVSGVVQGRRGGCGRQDGRLVRVP